MKKGGIQPNQIYNESMCDQVILLLSSGKSIARIAADLGVCRDTIYEWRDKHPEFERAFKKGKDACQAYWEDLGHDGICGEIKNFSATAWMFTMKNRFREDYREEKQEKTVSESIVEKLIDKLVE